MSIQTSVSAAVATITLDRPDKLNAFVGTMREDLLAALCSCEADDAVRAIVITGAGRAFCAGGDVEFMSRLQQNRDAAGFRALLEAGAAVIEKIATMRKPVIASLNGIAAGAGCNLALACDLRIASDRARLSQSFVKIGLHPDWGGTWLLPRLVGRSRAFELLASGRAVDAPEALALGLVDRVVPAGDLARETRALAALLAAAPPIALAGIKRALSETSRNAIGVQLALEADNQLRCFESADAAEGLAAFFEKRTPVWTGK